MRPTSKKIRSSEGAISGLQADAKATFLRDCKRAFLDALKKGPATMSGARMAAGLIPPEGVDGRAAGGVVVAMAQAEEIRPLGWKRSPLQSQHHCPVGLWELSL